MIIDLFDFLFQQIYNFFLAKSLCCSKSHIQLFSTRSDFWSIPPDFWLPSNLIRQTSCISSQKKGQISAALVESDNLSWEISMQFPTILFSHISTERKRLVVRHKENTIFEKTEKIPCEVNFNYFVTNHILSILNRKLPHFQSCKKRGWNELTWTSWNFTMSLSS